MDGREFRLITLPVSGSMTSLAEYDSRRQMRNVPTMVAIDWLNRLYGTNFAPVVMARSLGLYGVNRFGALKVSAAFGYSQFGRLKKPRSVHQVIRSDVFAGFSFQLYSQGNQTASARAHATAITQP